MTTFLQLVAEDLYDKIGTELADTAVVFPNKRASLFFNEYLARRAGRPVWSPAFLSISELFRSLSPLRMGDSIRLVCELHKVYQQVTGSTETLDDFYFWGELLISDFDDVDKNKVEADKLFSNLSELQALGGDYSFLSPEQVEAIRQFFSNFSIEQPTRLKEKFTTIWDHLGKLYTTYKDTLLRQGIAYEGMMYRQAIEQLDASTLPCRHYVFVGFNVLNRVERELFRKLRDAGKALFYWDYDRFYLRPAADGMLRHEAGEFLLRNLQEFPNALTDEALFDTLGQPKEVRYIAAPTENAQARFLHQWISPDTWEPEHEKEHAVVLCDESLLLPVLHSIPDCVRRLNVTMGFPLSGTPVSGFVSALTELQTRGYDAASGRFRHEAVLTVLKHPYTQRLSPQADELLRWIVKNNRFYPTLDELRRDDFLTQVFTPRQGARELCVYLTEMLRQAANLYQTGEDETDASDAFGQLYRESLFKAYTLVNRLLSLIDDQTLDVQEHTLRRLLSRLMAGAAIPFHGEPAVGMQVMGLLETRNLDFRHLLLLSVNEGKLPHAESDASFVPYNLRKAFGMTTIEHKISVYAYYFYRLLQRAESVTLLYNTSTDGLNRGEMSRFMLQFLIDWPHPVSREYLYAPQTPQADRRITVAKTPDVMLRLTRRFDARKDEDAPAEKRQLLSPSALNSYIDCPLKFYFRYVAGLRVPDEVSAEIDNALFGTLYHKAAQLIYEDLTRHGSQIPASDIEALLKDRPRLQDYVDRAFKQDFFKLREQEKSRYNGTQLINFDVILKYITQLLRNDQHHAPFALRGMEMLCTETFRVGTPDGDLPVRIGGYIDRLDQKGDTLRVIDYKTGTDKGDASDIEALFTPAPRRQYHIFQAFLYSAILSRRLREEGRSLKVQPALYYILNSADPGYEPQIVMGGRGSKQPVTDFAAQHEEEYRDRLRTLLQEIFSPEVPFAQTDDDSHCKYCDFRQLCRR